MSNIIAVFDGDGPVGKSVIQALSGTFQIRAITKEGSAIGSRDSTGNTQRVTVNYSNQSSMESALHGVEACFVVTKCDFTDTQSVRNEIQEGKMIALACSRAGVCHVVYSTQLNVCSITGVPARHMDAKADIEKCFREYNIPLTGLIIPCCYEMLLVEPLRPKRMDPNQYAIEIPIGRNTLPMMSVTDIGHVTRAIFLQLGQFVDKTLSPCGDKCTMEDIVRLFNKHLAPTRFKDNQITLEAFRRQPYLGADDIANMLDFYCRVDQRASMDLTKKLCPAVTSLEQWIMDNREEINKALDYPEITSPEPSWG